MNDPDLALLFENPEWFHVLAAYDQEPVQAEEPDDEASNWLARVRHVEEVKAERLPRIHGKLIAHGFLKFELGGRTEGVRYRLSTLGRRMVGKYPTLSGDAMENIELARSA